MLASISVHYKYFLLYLLLSTTRCTLGLCLETLIPKTSTKGSVTHAVHFLTCLMELTSTVSFGILKRGFIRTNSRQQNRTAQLIWLLLSRNLRLILFQLPLPTLPTATNLLLGTSHILLSSTFLQLIHTLKNLLVNTPSLTTVHTSTTPANSYIWKPSLILSPTLANPVILTTFFVFLPNSTSISTQKTIFMTSSTLFLVKKLILNLLIIYKSNILASTFSTLFLQKFYFQSPIPKLTLLQESLPATPKAWKELITDMTNFSNLLERYFLTIFFSLQGPYPSSPDPDDSKPLYQLLSLLITIYS